MDRYNRLVDSSPDYQASLNDAEIIEKIKKQYDLTKLSDVEKICQLLLTGSIKFESKTGNDFDDHIFELREELRNTPIKSPGSKPVNKGVNKSNIQGSKAKTIKRKTTLDDLDDDMRDKVIQELKKQQLIRTISIVVLFLLAVSCIGYFAIYNLNSDKSEKRFQELAQLKGSDALASGSDEGYVATLTEDGIVIPPVLECYKTLYNSNKNLIGWLKIDDTNIDYPVMQCGDNEYYLSHNFDSEEDAVGTLFLDYQCDVIRKSDNYIIYGHHLQSGRMFSSLVSYEDESYYEGHKYIQFDTIYEEQLYQVMYAFRSRVYSDDQVVFKYYQFIDANSEEEFNSYMNEMAEEAFYDTGVRAFYGDQLLTLSTCDYHETNGRFVVVAKRIQ